MSVRDDLLAAYTLIQDESRWCHGGGYAETVDGEFCFVHDQCAARFCVEGAVARVTRHYGSRAEDVLSASAHRLFGDGAIRVNDDYGHRAALMVLRHAILREEGLA